MFALARPDRSLARTNRGETQRWEPWGEMERMRQEMDDLVTRAFGFTPPSHLLNTPRASSVPVELYETPDAYTLRAHLPGMAREDINLEVTGSRITLSGEQRVNAPAEGAKVLVKSAGFGRFHLDYELPVEIKSGEVQATYRDGILEVTLPKVEAARPQSVKIDIGQ